MQSAHILQLCKQMKELSHMRALLLQLIRKVTLL